MQPTQLRLPRKYSRHLALNLAKSCGEEQSQAATYMRSCGWGTWKSIMLGTPWNIKHLLDPPNWKKYLLVQAWSPPTESWAPWAFQSKKCGKCLQHAIEATAISIAIVLVATVVAAAAAATAAVVVRIPRLGWEKSLLAVGPKSSWQPSLQIDCFRMMVDTDQLKTSSWMCIIDLFAFWL